MNVYVYKKEKGRRKKNLHCSKAYYVYIYVIKTKRKEKKRKATHAWCVKACMHGGWGKVESRSGSMSVVGKKDIKGGTLVSR